MIRLFFKFTFFPLKTLQTSAGPHNSSKNVVYLTVNKHELGVTIGLVHNYNPLLPLIQRYICLFALLLKMVCYNKNKEKWDILFNKNLQ